MKRTIAAAALSMFATAAGAQEPYPQIVVTPSDKRDECVHRALVDNMQGVTEGIVTTGTNGTFQSILVLESTKDDFFSITQTLTLAPNGFVESIDVDMSRTLPEAELDGVHIIQNGRSRLAFDDGAGRIVEGTGAGISDTDVKATEYVHSLYWQIFENCTLPSQEAGLSGQSRWMDFTPA